MRRFSWFYRNQISITAKAMQYSLFTVFVSANHRTEICIFVTFFAAFFSLFQLISDSNASLWSKTNWHYQLILFSLILITWLKSVLFFFQHFFLSSGHYNQDDRVIFLEIGDQEPEFTYAKSNEQRTKIRIQFLSICLHISRNYHLKVCLDLLSLSNCRLKASVRY